MIFGVKNKMKSSIFLRMFAAFLLVMIPVFALGIYIYNWGIKTVKDEILRSTSAQVDFSLQIIERETEQLKILLYDCLNDEYLNKLSILYPTMNDYEYTECLRQLQLRLKTIENSSSFAKNVSAHIMPINRTISSSSGLDDLNLEKFQTIRVPQDKKGAQFIDYGGKLFLSTLHENQITHREPLYMIEIEINPDAFSEALEQFNVYPESGSFFINSSNNMIISQKSDIELSPYDLVGIDREFGKTGTALSRVGKETFLSVYHHSEYLDILLLRYFPQHYVLTPLKNFTIWVWIFSTISVGIIFIFTLYMYVVVQKPITLLVHSFRKVENGDLSIKLEEVPKDEFGYLYRRFNEMVHKLEMLINQVYRQKILMQKAELKQLQSQINPHFLYNSFFSINTMARLGDENLIPFTKHLGEYFRFLTRSNSDNVTLCEEVEHARSYTAIQSMRFARNLDVTFEDCPPDYLELMVPRLILQPIIENAFKYAVELRNNKIIAIRFRSEKNKLRIVVEDNGNKIDRTKIEKLKAQLTTNNGDTEISGLINIHRRMQLAFNKESGIQLERSPLGGLMVILTLNFSRSDD
jgi:two-component system, sensor histidine kinase YesM